MQPVKYARKPFLIEALRVTEANMVEVANWCKGTILEAKRGEKTIKYIQVPVSRPANERQKKAFIGDYVLYAGKGFKCYPPKAFDDCFEKPSEELLAKQAQHDSRQLALFGPPSDKDLKALSSKYAAGQV